MSALAVEVNDVGPGGPPRRGLPSRCPRARGSPCSTGARLLVGAEAADAGPSQAALRARHVLGSARHRARRPCRSRRACSRADLAHAQLARHSDARRATRSTEAFLAVPGFWSAGALSLLLSVARAAGLPVVGLVDAAVAAASLGHEGESLLHLDLTRHRACRHRDDARATR